MIRKLFMFGLKFFLAIMVFGLLISWWMNK